MKTLLAGIGVLSSVGAADAQAIQLDPALEARVRYERVEQDGLPRTAQALTVRLRPGITARQGRWTALIEVEAVAALIDRYADGLGGRAGYPTVADPENLELNRAQIGYAVPGIAATAGRQRIALADERFVGSAPWRQSEQTFDAVRTVVGKSKGLSLDTSYSWSVRTVNGRDGFGARPTAIGGDNLFALLNYGGRSGTITAFTYLVDQDEAAVQGYRLSSRTHGLRIAGNVPAGSAKLGYAASWAVQSDYGRNPNRYKAEYWLGEVSAAARGATLLGGYEVLGADRGLALTSVQTPLASAFKFNGWAGKFTTTPPDGLRDRYISLGYALPKTRAGAMGFSAILHDFSSDRVRRRYGREIDLLATLKRGPGTFSVRYARYRADTFATDTDKFWLQLDLSA